MEIRALVVASLIISLLLIATASIVSYAWNNRHPDRCQPCHGPATEVTDNNIGNINVWSHDIQEGNQVWNNCINCHSNYVAGTAHNDLGCKGCHAVLHIGYYDGNNYMASLWYWEVSNPNNNLIIAPDAADLQKKKLILDSTNASTYIPNIGTYVGATGEEIEVGLWDAFSNQYIETSPDLPTPDDAYRICFSCHFLATDPSQVGVFAIVDGSWKIGIPASALEQEPHNIMPISSTETGYEGGGGFNEIILLVGVAIIGLALIGVARPF